MGFVGIRCLACFLLVAPFSLIDSFVTPSRPALLQNQNAKTSSHTFPPPPTAPFSLHSSSSSSSSPGDELSDERKASLFQYLLRDFQIEGVPLLEVDVDQVHTLQAALWTTLAALAQDETGQKAVLVLQDMDVETLQTVVNDFVEMQACTSPNYTNVLPELERFRLSLVGKGVGPAILVETQNVTSSVSPPASAPTEDEETTALKQQASIKAFASRMLSQVISYPTVDSPFLVTTSAARQGGACQVLASFWTSACTLLTSPSQEAGSIMLTLPLLSPESDPQLVQFGAVSSLLSRQLKLHPSVEAALDLDHFHPHYNRDEIVPNDERVHGHLPPKLWLSAMLKQSGNQGALDLYSPADLGEVYDYQRRAPLPAVWIKRKVLMVAVDPGDGEVELELENGSKTRTTNVVSDSAFFLALVQKGAKRLQEELNAEIDILR